MIEKVSNVNNLYDAFFLSKKGADWKESVQRYEMNLLRNIFSQSSELNNKEYKQKDFFEFDLNERGKKRHIKSLHISDRVIQRSFCDNVLTPATQDKIIYDNGASVKNKGITFAQRRMVIHLRKYFEEYKTNEGYILQIDFRKFFDSIPHKQLIEEFSKLLDQDEFGLFESLVQTFNINGEQVSVGIGSQISQICGIYYPTPIDNYFKCVRGCRYYGRYQDDTYIIRRHKEELQDLLNVYCSLADKLGLTVNLKKTQIVKISHGFTFLKTKYLLKKDGTIIKRISRQNITRERRKLKKYKKMEAEGKISLNKIQQAYLSWRGTYKRYNSHTTILSMDKHFNSLFGGIYDE